MRALVALMVLVCATASAEPDPSRRKASPDKFAKAAGESFNAAYAADQRGELPTALGLYQRAFAISPHPSTAYNIADVQRRLGMLADAIRSYETYLLLSPKAADRAEVTTLIEKLARTPGTLLLVTGRPDNPHAVDFERSYLLVSGEIKKKPGPVARTPNMRNDEPAVELQVRAGKHTLDVVTALTYSSHTCVVKPGALTRCDVSAPPRVDGTAVLSMSQRFRAFRGNTTNGRSASVGGRFDLPPGRHKLALRDRSYECPPVVLDIGGANTVTYVFVSSSEYDGFRRCRTLDVKQHRLQFDP